MTKLSKAYDYIVVGGGSAGCTLASRLSEDASREVLLIEAGIRDSSPYIHLPVTYYKTTGPKFIWGYETARQKFQENIVTPFTQAKVLGGGSSINAQVYMRGTPSDFDAWEKEDNCPGWGFKDVLPFYKKAEDNSRLAGELHGSGGPLKVSDQSYTHPLTFAWLKSCQEAGLNHNDDFNSASRGGCGLYQVTNRDGKRSSAANCYLHPIEKRKNLTVITDVQVMRVVFENKRAVGVELKTESSTSTVMARREIILTAGAIGTPKIMLHSGIGAKEELQQKGISLTADSPEVGKNFQDHLDVFMIYELSGAHSYDKYKKLHWQLWAGLQFALFRAGPVMSNVVEGGAFWWVDQDNKHADPDVQYHFLAGAGVEAGIPDVPSGNGCTLNAYLTRPKSRGTVTVADNDPLKAPVIDPNFLSDPDDLAKTVESIRLGRKMMSGSSMAPYLKQEHFPGSAVQSQAELEDFVRKQARTGYHPVGTCRMGDDAHSVVDTELRVRGVTGLRIADNSIMPRLISGNTNATAIMIAERAAEFIRKTG
ncbi:GMC family oxidoreductase [Klebsiella variicola]|uniref:GMC family oxidoreductase n=1 Tax=Klebsiella variicola TaxID=244366 RepID=UPI001C24DAEB|nr:GMC family oxidoreductase N-terminal domain-containing protein [Klebsiella variicola]MBU9731531.1 GMC family oxidoreductase N-terminal domain-containing protein [Klebsiella variicola]